jgi:transposase
MTRQRKKFTREQKFEAVRQIEHGEKTLSEVGRELGVAASTVSAWRKEWQEHGKEAFPGQGKGSSNSMDQELAQLRRENASLKEDNEILKKAAAYFARDVR